MKYLKLFENLENLSPKSISDIIKQYDELRKIMKPIVLKKYYKLANDITYEPDYGDMPNPNDDAGDLFLNEMSVDGNNFYFILITYDKQGQLYNEYHIDLNGKEIEQLVMEIDAEKYNI